MVFRRARHWISVENVSSTQLDEKSRMRIVYTLSLLRSKRERLSKVPRQPPLSAGDVLMCSFIPSVCSYQVFYDVDYLFYEMESR